MSKINLAGLLEGIANGLAHLAGGVALPPAEHKSIEDIVNNILDNVHKVAVPEVKISKTDIEKVLKPMVEASLKSYDDRLKALENAK